MKAKFALASAAFSLILLGGSAAQATPGSNAGSGSVSVQNVWTSTYRIAMSSSQTETVTVDCPSGKDVVTGYGIQIWGDLSASLTQGSASDGDSWQVTFQGPGGQQQNMAFTVHATCA